jgi:hypothetical protein
MFFSTCFYLIHPKHTHTHTHTHTHKYALVHVTICDLWSMTDFWSDTSVLSLIYIWESGYSLTMRKPECDLGVENSPITWMIIEWLVTTWEVNCAEQRYDPLSLGNTGSKCRIKMEILFLSSQLVCRWCLSPRSKHSVPFNLHQVTLGLLAQYFTGHSILKGFPTETTCSKCLLTWSCTSHGSSPKNENKIKIKSILLEL